MTSIASWAASPTSSAGDLIRHRGGSNEKAPRFAAGLFSFQAPVLSNALSTIANPLADMIMNQALDALFGAKGSGDGGMALTPNAANNLLKRLKVILAFAVDISMIRVDPVAGMKGFKVKSEGFHTWSEDEIALYEAKHPIGSKARLAMALML